MLRAIDRAIIAVNRMILILALGAMSVIVFVNVVMRYLTNDSLVWAEEVARYLMVWSTFLGIGLVLRYGGHVGVDSLQQSVSSGLARILRIVSLLVVGAFCVAMVWYGYQYADRTQFQTTPVTEISFSWVSASVAAGFLLALWHLFAVARGYALTGKFEESPDVDLTQAGSL